MGLGLLIASDYIRIPTPDHPSATQRGWVYEHRLVAEVMLGRYLLQGEEVHHKNGNKSDNRPENLSVCASRWDHQEEHGGSLCNTWPENCSACEVPCSEQTKGCKTCYRRHKMRRRRARLGMRVCV